MSPKGLLITVLTADGSVRRLPTPEAWRGQLCAKLTRNISHDQWREWVSPDID